MVDISAVARRSAPARTRRGAGEAEQVVPVPEPTGLRVRLFGGFEVWCDGRPVEGFESQKVRALLAYLACHPGRTLARDHLAGLFWPDRSPESARHALRQAAYNLKASLPAGVRPPLLGSYNGLQLDPAAGTWSDVAAFEEAVRLGRGRDGFDLHQLTTAAQLYRGELLSGFFLRDCEAFEEWLVAEQERLREMAVEVLRTLVSHYRERGEHRFGLYYARRLVTLEPLSEEGRRDLMRLAALAGRRSLALAEYDRLRTLLRSELGVDPLDETRALYDSILLEQSEPGEPSPEAEVLGPIVPLVGRSSALAALRETWKRVLTGRSCLTVVAGEDGIGKTRLVKSFLGSAVVDRRVRVLKGRCHELAPPRALGPFREILANAAAEEAQASATPFSTLPEETLAELARLVPEFRSLPSGLPPSAPQEGDAGRGRLFEAVGHLLEGLCRQGPGRWPCDPLVLFLDDVHLADRSSCELLDFLLARLDGLPVWILVTAHPDLSFREREEGGIRRIDLDPLPVPALWEIAAALVGEGQAGRLVALLTEGNGGLPLTVTEQINALWDAGVLAQEGGEHWSLRSGAGTPIETLDALCLARLGRLPSSTRRLAFLAAVAGPTFDAGLLVHAGDEHPAVVDIGLEVLLKRWLIRQHAPSWRSGGRQRDVVLWAQGARRGAFEFAHPRTRAVFYRTLDPLRRQILHGQIVQALEELHGAGDDRIYEELAWHAAAAGFHDSARSWAARAARNARALGADDVAEIWTRQALPPAEPQPEMTVYSSSR